MTLTKERGLENVFHFHGFVEDMRVWCQALDLAILVSRREGLARAMIEPLAYGIPVVAFDITSTREILEQHACGIVVPRGDYAHLVVEQYEDIYLQLMHLRETCHS